MSRVYLVRHGQTDWNHLGRLQGSTNIPLNDTGRTQAKVIAAELARIVPTASRVVASTLDRAQDTGQVIADALSVPLSMDDRLKERSFGVWEGTTHAQRLKADPVQVQRWTDGHEPHIDGYEPQVDLMTRMAAAVVDAAQDAPGPVIVVGHGSALRAGICALTEIPATPAQAHSVLGGIGNVHWSTVFAYPHGWSLEAYNIAPRGLFS